MANRASTLMRSIGYARVSTREQADVSNALEQQIERLKAAGAGEIFNDVDSGSKDKRPAFNEVMELVRSHLIDEVVVTRLDRLTRSLPTLRKALDTFRESGVNLRALDDSIDMKTAAGKFHLNMLGALAEMEVDRLSERVRHGWQHLRDRKIAMNPPFGYAKIDDRHQLNHRPFLCLLEGHQERSKAQIAPETPPLKSGGFLTRTVRPVRLSAHGEACGRIIQSTPSPKLSHCCYNILVLRCFC